MEKLLGVGCGGVDRGSEAFCLPGEEGISFSAYLAIPLISLLDLSKDILFFRKFGVGEDGIQSIHAGGGFGGFA